ncbi:MAG TPA: hypothetical protein VGC62_24235 [Pseudomonas sp.]|uniref:hypothetical protein n=1 Tax=Pseudomonas sp. TaxID=306 RepID=UPI002ED7E9EC
MKRPYLKHPFIVSILLIGSWLSLWLPVYLLTPELREHDEGEAILDYARYVILALVLSCVSLLPVIIGGIYLWLKKKDPLLLGDRVFLFITYLPALGLAALNLYVAIDGLFNLWTFIVPALLYFSLLVYLTLGFPAKTNR